MMADSGSAFMSPASITKFFDPLEKAAPLAVSSLPCTIHHLYDLIALRGAEDLVVEYPLQFLR
jgi:hypothetical protein